MALTEVFDYAGNITFNRICNHSKSHRLLPDGNRQEKSGKTGIPDSGIHPFHCGSHWREPWLFAGDVYIPPQNQTLVFCVWHASNTDFAHYRNCGIDLFADSVYYVITALLL